MSHDAYYEIYLHIVWHTKGNAALLRGAVEREVHDFLRERIIGQEDAFIDEIGGTDDHVHLAVHVAPTLEVAKWIGELKGACSHYINTEVVKQKMLYWQRGYGVVSFGKKNLPVVVDYIRRQREHHSQGGLVDRLEWFGRREGGG